MLDGILGWFKQELKSSVSFEPESEASMSLEGGTKSIKLSNVCTLELDDESLLECSGEVKRSINGALVRRSWVARLKGASTDVVVEKDGVEVLDSDIEAVLEGAVVRQCSLRGYVADKGCPVRQLRVDVAVATGCRVFLRGVVEMAEVSQDGEDETVTIDRIQLLSARILWVDSEKDEQINDSHQQQQQQQQEEEEVVALGSTLAECVYVPLSQFTHVWLYLSVAAALVMCIVSYPQQSPHVVYAAAAVFICLVSCAMTLSCTFDANALLGKQVVPAACLQRFCWPATWGWPSVYHRQLYDTAHVGHVIQLLLLRMVLALMGFFADALRRLVDNKVPGVDGAPVIDGMDVIQVGHSPADEHTALGRWSTVLFTNSWNAWGFVGALQPGQTLPQYAMPSMFVRAFHGGGASLRENLKAWGAWSATERNVVASEMFTAFVRRTSCVRRARTSSGDHVSIRGERSMALVVGFVSQKRQFNCVIINAQRNSFSAVCCVDGAAVSHHRSCHTDWFAVMGQPRTHDDLLGPYLKLSGQVNGADKRLAEVGLAAASSPPLSSSSSSSPFPVHSSSSKARPFPFVVPTGWCSWYHFFEHITVANLTDNLKKMAKLRSQLELEESGLELFQVDDGYQRKWGDWLSLDAKKFPGGGHAPMKDLVGAIVDAGFVPGLWMAPFACDADSELQKMHPKWILRDKPAGKPLNSANCGKFFYGMDVTNPEVAQHVRQVLNTAVNDWGFRYLKLDFLYASALEGCNATFFDKTQSPAQAMQTGMRLIATRIWGDRRPVENEEGGDQESSEGDDADPTSLASTTQAQAQARADRPVMVLGCGAPLGAVLGHVHANRVSCDAGLSWFAGLPLPWWDQWNLPSARTMLKSTMCRMSMHGRWWINDPDCMIIRNSSDVSFTDDEIWGLAAVKAFSGGSFLLSDNLDVVCNGVGMSSRREFLQQLLPATGRAAIVVDLLHRDMPELLRLPCSAGGLLASAMAVGNWGEFCKAHRLGAAHFFGASAVTEYAAHTGTELPAVGHVARMDGVLVVSDLRTRSLRAQPLDFYVDSGGEVYDEGFQCSPVAPHCAAILFVRWIPVRAPSAAASPVSIYLGSSLHYTGSYELEGMREMGRARVELAFRSACVRSGVVWVALADQRDDAHTAVPALACSGPMAVSATESPPKLVTTVGGWHMWEIRVASPKRSSASGPFTLTLRPFAQPVDEKLPVGQM